MIYPHTPKQYLLAYYDHNMLTNIVLVYGGKSCSFIYQHIEKHLIPQKYDSFLDLLSKNIKTNRNKRVFFAVEFLTEKL